MSFYRPESPLSPKELIKMQRDVEEDKIDVIFELWFQNYEWLQAKAAGKSFAEFAVDCCRHLFGVQAQ